MSVQYKFSIRGTEHQVEASWKKGTFYTKWDTELFGKVDEYICDWLNVPVKEKEYHPLFDPLTNFALSSLMRLGGSDVEQKHVELILDMTKDHLKRPVEIALIKNLFLEKYIFTAWR